MPGTYALTTVARVQEFLGERGNDALLDRLIDAATAEIEAHCQRQFLSRAYAKWLDGHGDAQLWLPHWPLSSITRVCIGGRDVMALSNAATDAAYASARVTSTGVILTVGGGAYNGASSLLFADYATLDLLAAAIIALNKGWTATVLTGTGFGSFPSFELRAVGALGCLRQSVNLQAPDEATDGYDVDEDTGVIIRDGGWPRGRRNIFVAWTGGYAAAPAAVEQVCVELVAEMFNRTKLDTNLVSESFEGLSTTLKTELARRQDLAAKLQPWRRMIA